MVTNKSMSAFCKITALVIAGSFVAHLALLHWLGYAIALLIAACLGLRYGYGHRTKSRILDRYRSGMGHIYSDYTDSDREEVSQAEETMQEAAEFALFLSVGAVITLVGHFGLLAFWRA